MGSFRVDSGGVKPMTEKVLGHLGGDGDDDDDDDDGDDGEEEQEEKKIGVESIPHHPKLFSVGVRMISQESARIRPMFAGCTYSVVAVTASVISTTLDL